MSSLTNRLRRVDSDRSRATRGRTTHLFGIHTYTGGNRLRFKYRLRNVLESTWLLFECCRW